MPVLVIALAVGYGWALRRGRAPGAGAAVCFGIGLLIAAAATVGPVATHAPVLFWVRALQVLLLLYVAPLFLALGRPLTALAAASPAWRARIERAVTSAPGRVIGSPWTTSLAMMALPWLLYLTPWYVSSMRGVVAWLTEIVLTAVGFAYFYARLQADPVPRRYTPLVSVMISVLEGLADGVLGVVLWLGPLIAVDYYVALGRQGGPSMRVDQAVGAGILWIGGDLFGLAFVMVLLRAVGRDERRRAAEVDAALDAQPPTGSGLWWENDPQLRERFGR